MTYKDLKEKIDAFTEEQLKQPIYVFKGDDEIGVPLESMEITDEDFYYDAEEGLGNIEEVKLMLGDDWETEIKEYTKVPKGTASLHIEMPD